MLVKDIADSHDRPLFKINQLINSNRTLKTEFTGL